MLIEYGANGKISAAYDYGVQRNNYAHDGITEYYTYDGRGSVANLTDTTGASTVAYQYDTYGVAAASAPTQNRYDYNAEATDYNTGYQYLRARYYNPANGNFITQDTYTGELDTPLSQNRYTYAENDPMNNIDPSGHFSVKNAWNSFKKGVSNATSAVTRTATKAVNAVKSTGAYQAAATAYNKAKTGAVNLYNKTKNYVTNTKAYQTVSRKVTQAKQYVNQQYNNAKQWVGEKYTAAQKKARQLQDAVSKLPSKIRNNIHVVTAIENIKHCTADMKRGIDKTVHKVKDFVKDGWEDGWLKKVTIAAGVVAALAAATAATVATGGAAAPLLIAALKGSLIGLTVGAGLGAGGSALTKYLKTGTLKGSEKEILNAMSDGMLGGAFGGAVAGSFTNLLSGATSILQALGIGSAQGVTSGMAARGSTTAANNAVKKKKDSVLAAMFNPKAIATDGILGAFTAALTFTKTNSTKTVKNSNKSTAKSTKKATGKVTKSGVKNTSKIVENNTKKTDFYVTPKGDAIPASRDDFYNNLSQMKNNNGKFLGETSKGPVRIRVENAHQPSPNYSGNMDNDHLVDHIHIEYRKNGVTGPWGIGDNNKTTIPQSWIN